MRLRFRIRFTSLDYLTDIDLDGDVDVIGGESWGGKNRDLWSTDGVANFKRSLISDSGGCYNCALMGPNLLGPTSFTQSVLSTPLVKE